jgi:hypothetical protein
MTTLAIEGGSLPSIAAILGRIDNSSNSAYNGHEIGPPVTMIDVFPALMIMPWKDEYNMSLVI